MEYDFIVAPGADPNAIKLAFEGADKLEVNIQGDLILYAGVGELRLHRPRVYQVINGVRQEIPGGYVLNPEPGVQTPRSQFVSFHIAAYDASRPIIIDPVLSYSTYLGGTGSDTGASIAVDSAGNAYVTGSTSSTDFPTSGVVQPVFGGFTDVFVTKLNPTGSALVYSTYLGGSNVDQGFGIAVDSSGNAYVTGETSSHDFPTTPGAYRTIGGFDDAFVAKLDATGSGLAYSTYLGGNLQDQGKGIAVDSSGNAYVAGTTQTPDFPITPGVFQPIFGGGSNDGFVAKLNAAGSALVYSSFLGGSSLFEEKILGIAVDSSGNAYVTGMTSSTDFPTTIGAFQPAFGGGSSRAFVAKVNSAGTNLVYSTYLGGNGATGSG